MKDIFFKYRSWILVGIGVLAVIGVVWYIQTSNPPSFGTVAATKGNVIESVSAPGTVLAERNVNLSFQEPGQIAHVYVNEGDTVGGGQSLMDLDRSSLAASAEQANAVLSAAQAKLDGITSGTRPEQLQIYQSAVQNAQASLSAAAGSAYAAADDAVHNQTDNLFSNPQSNSPVLAVPVSDAQLETNIQNQRLAIGTTLANWYATSNAPSSSASSLASTANIALAQIESYLNALAIAVNNATISQSTLAGYKADVVTARTEVTAAVNSLTSAESALTAAQNQLILAQAGATPQDIEAQQAVVAQAKATALSAQVALDHASLVAPFAGTVGNLTAKIGQVVSPGVPVASLTNNNGLKIQIYVSQTDVSKIKPGDAASLTLDAIGTGTPFPATVTTVDASQTQVNGVSAYMVTLHFTNADSRIKDGMTGNIKIVAAEHDDVIRVPSNLVISDGDNYFVLVKHNGTTERRQVAIGLVGDQNTTEIVSGLEVGDQLINY